MLGSSGASSVDSLLNSGEKGRGSIMNPEHSLTFGSKASARHARRANSQRHQGRAPL